LEGNLSCETGTPINSQVTPIEGTIRSFPLFALEGDCLSGLETVGGWYQVVGNGNVFTLTACSLDNSKSVGISVFTNVCFELQCIEHQSRQIAACKNGNGHSASFSTEEGKPYNILISGLPVGAPIPGSETVTIISSSPKDRRLQDEDELETDFVLDITESETPPNSKCGTALPTSFENAITGSTMGLLTTYDTCYDSQQSGAWYTVTGSEPNKFGVIVYEANTCNPGADFYNTMSVFRGDACESHTCVDVDILPCPNGWFGQQIYWATSAEENYQVFVHSSDVIEAQTYNAGNFLMNLNFNDRLANDQCNAASEVALNRQAAVKSTTSGAKPDMKAIENSSCGTGGAGAWHTVTGTGSVFQASTCSGNTNHRTEIQVFSGECGKLTCLVSGGGNRALCGNGKGSVVNFKTQKDVVYHVLITARRESETGIFGLEINELPELSKNNDCWASETIGKNNASVSGNTLAATVDFSPGDECVVPLDSPGVWYEIEGIGKGVEVSTCQNNDFDSAISVFTGECGSLQCVAGSAAADKKCTDGKGVTTSFYAESKKKYHVYVHGQYGSNSMGNFTLSYDEFNILEANEFCTAARDVPTDGTRVQGSTEDASHAAIPTASCGVPVTNPGLWYTFKGNGQPFEIRACSEDEGEFDVSISIFKGGPEGCNSLTCITGTTFADSVCSTSQERRFLQGGLSPSSEFRFMTDPAQDYYIFVHGTDGTEGVGDFALYIRDENVAGFGTESPTVTPIDYGKDLYRWIPVNTSSLIIPTDYLNLEMVFPPTDGNVTLQGYSINYTANLGFEGNDVMTLDGCNDGQCYRFDVTVNVQFEKVDPNAAANDDDDGWNKMWLLLLLLLVIIPLACLPCCLFYRKKKREKEGEYDYGSEDDEEEGLDDDELPHHEGDKGLLPNQSKSNGNDSSDDGEDWESSDDDDSGDEDDSRDSKSSRGSEDKDSDEESDGFRGGFQGESDRSGDGFSDEYGGNRR